ncbi:hypothetical protein B0A52_00364 [Exophiala mesophila]|uniref:Uncharacterized protein n=1 Tax=Exophiala mesophila TaxID=212818 RepID=A0A438NJU7_EXOME|nr:hypothetical protein B0A52_00364 [Exophiala mesophila]
MCYRTDTRVICSNCSTTITAYTGEVVECRRRPTGGTVLKEIDLNTDEMCNGVEVDEDVSEGGLCHNCTILEDAERRNRERLEDDTDNESMEEVC